MKRELFTYIILAVLSGALLVARAKVTTIPELPVRLSTGLLEVFHSVKQESSETVRSIVEAKKLKEENINLRLRLMDLRHRLRRSAALETENRKLKRLLGIKRVLKLKAIPARVVGWLGNYWDYMFKLDKGKRDGVAAGMAVVGANGIVGQIRYVYDTYSVAISNTNPDFSVHVEDYRSRVRGVARGNGYRIKVDYINPAEDVRMGDLFVSTGIGGIFPPGLFVGRVVRVTKSIEERFLNVELVPSDRIEKNRYVLIVGEGFGSKKKKGRKKR